MRRSIASIALIRREENGQTLWLARWNPHWNAYGLVGGHKRPEESFRESMVRAVAEELGLIANEQFAVAPEPLAHFENTAWSERAQTQTRYTMELFENDLTAAARRQVDANAANRWLKNDEIQSRQTLDGTRASPTIGLVLERAELLRSTNPQNSQPEVRRDD